MLKAGVQIYEKQFHLRYFDWFIPLLRKHILFIQKSNVMVALWENARVSLNFLFSLHFDSGMILYWAQRLWTVENFPFIISDSFAVTENVVYITSAL